MPTKPSKNSSPLSVWLPFFVIQIPMFHSWWKWTLPPPGLELCCPSYPGSRHASSLITLNPYLLIQHAYYSRKLTPAEQNYDIGNRELLAIKLALKEWGHWLEGANHPFTVITYHQNLQYLREAKRLNPHQARWALFFTWFHFTITYHPGNRNCKTDALSRLISTVTPSDPEPIHPPALIVSPIE